MMLVTESVSRSKIITSPGILAFPPLLLPLPPEEPLERGELGDGTGEGYTR